MRIDRDHVPDDLVNSGSERRHTHDEQSSVTGFEPLVAVVDLLTSFVENLELAERRFELLAEPDFHLCRRAVHFAADRRIRVVEKRVRFGRRCHSDGEEKNEEDKVQTPHSYYLRPNRGRPHTLREQIIKVEMQLRDEPDIAAGE